MDLLRPSRPAPERPRPLRHPLRRLRPGPGPHRGRVLLPHHREVPRLEDEVFRARCIIVKEERAELAKHHIDVMWHDYFKPEHVEKFPDLHDVCWKASKQASQVKRTSTLEAPEAARRSSTRSTRCGRAAAARPRPAWRPPRPADRPGAAGARWLTTPPGARRPRPRRPGARCIERSSAFPAALVAGARGRRGHQHGARRCCRATGCWPTRMPIAIGRRAAVSWCSLPDPREPRRLLVKRVAAVDARRVG